ncbi:MAG: beta-glucosidase [Candidatus Marinimicrobia bacterium]|nr:beta-glucosidase [Candidatus Neomarinimicrobiota bacterium]
MTSKYSFPNDFLWGVATSSYQIEGAHATDGKGPSIWDTFTQLPGNIKNGDTGNIACDHYSRWKDDVATMKDLGVQAYRFSISWPRVLPTGNGPDINEKGLAFYDRLVDGLLDANITPYITLYHWDLPQQIQNQGGWPHRSTVDLFVNYADIVSKKLGDRVKHWITHNEPWVVSTNGYLNGHHAPGHKSWGEALSATHHLLLSHGLAVPVIRNNSPNCEVGITLNLCPAYPASPSIADQQAAQQFDGEFNRWFLDPLFRGSYPEDVLMTHLSKKRIMSSDLSFIQDGDLQKISTPIDFLGLNYYSRAIIRSNEILEEENTPVEINPGERTDNGWEIHAESLHLLLKRLTIEYPIKAIYITENGAAYNIKPNGTSEIHDESRIKYIHDHLIACYKSLEDKVPLRGYFVWTLMDNFEWAEGYGQKFGLIHIDDATLNRIPKDSFHWYQRTIANNSLNH